MRYLYPRRISLTAAGPGLASFGRVAGNKVALRFDSHTNRTESPKTGTLGNIWMAPARPDHPRYCSPLRAFIQKYGGLLDFMKS